MTTTERILDLTSRGHYGLREAIRYVMEHPMRTAVLVEWVGEGRTLYRPGTPVIILEQSKDALDRQVYRIQTPDGRIWICFANELKED